jgi:biopolymer transport protein ExbD
MPLKVQQDEPIQLNLTPMIDVLFLLIIFFMVATTFGDLERNMELQVPEVTDAGDSMRPSKPLVINVFADGTVDLDGQPVTLGELTGRLNEARERAGQPTVVIRGDGACEFQNVASALAACKSAKISELGITVRIASGGGAAGGTSGASATR